jgi:hypothetical protein
MNVCPKLAPTEKREEIGSLRRCRIDPYKEVTKTRQLLAQEQQLQRYSGEL